MRQKRLIIIVLCAICTLIISVLAITRDREKLSTSKLSKYRSIAVDGTNEYIIDQTIDLQGDKVIIPPKSKLIFRNGMLSKGRIVGDSTEIIYNEMPIFDSIEIDGSWKIERISTKLFVSPDTCTLSNLSALSSDKQYNVISVDDECRIPIKAWSSYLTIKSNTNLILNADIYTLPTYNKGGYCINIVGHDIKVKGNGHFLFGTLASSDQKECPQWLHGLNIDSKSRKVIVEDVNSWLFCGDGFYNAGSDVTLDNVNAKFNGRQGLSITNGQNINILNSSFTHTGFYRINSSNGPGAGIDIEPNKASSVDNVKIINCTMRNNLTYLKGIANDLEILGAALGLVTVSECSFDGLYLGESDNVSISDSNGPFSVLYLKGGPANLKIRRSGHSEVYYLKPSMSQLSILDF